MSLCRKTCLLALFACLLGGCYEDTAEITLNSDGSGTIKQKLVLSERFLVSISESRGSRSAPAPQKEELAKEIGSAIEITSITQKDLPDGARVIELEGKFGSAKQFFLSEYCQKQIKLRIAPAGEAKAAIHCDMQQSDSGGPSLTQLYGLAKGLHIRRTITLPAKIEKSNGEPAKAKNAVSWATDLRNKEGLARTKTFLKGPDKGKGLAIFDASGLTFSLPLKLATAPDAPAAEPKTQKQPGKPVAKVTWISVQRAKKTDGTDIPKQSFTEIGVELTWDPNHRPVRYNTPVLLSLSDDRGEDLVTSDEPSVFGGKIYDYLKSKEIKLKEKAPSANAGKLTNLEGYVEVVTDVVTESIVLENVQALAGKDSTGNPVLDKLKFKIKSIKNGTLRISIDESIQKITSLFMIKDDGTKIKKRSSGGGAGNWSYGFDEDISKISKCELEVVVDETTVKVPFSLKEISLP